MVVRYNSKRNLRAIIQKNDIICEAADCHFLGLAADGTIDIGGQEQLYVFCLQYTTANT